MVKKIKTWKEPKDQKKFFDKHKDEIFSHARELNDILIF